MEHSTYKVVEIVGTSPDGVTEAINAGIGRAAETIRELDWFHVTDIRGHLDEGKVKHFQVSMKVGFRLEEG